MAEYNLTPITIQILESLGFMKKEVTHPVMQFYHYKSSSNIRVMVQIFPDGRWEPFICITDHIEEGDSHTASRALGNIKDLTDLGDFISYL